MGPMEFHTPLFNAAQIRLSVFYRFFHCFALGSILVSLTFALQFRRQQIQEDKNTNRLHYYPIGKLKK